MDQKRKELSGGKMEMGQASLDLGVELLGQEPEGMRFFEVSRWRSRWSKSRWPAP
jgi:hypothetical protein